MYTEELFKAHKAPRFGLLRLIDSVGFSWLYKHSLTILSLVTLGLTCLLGSVSLLTLNFPSLFFFLIFFPLCVTSICIIPLRLPQINLLSHGDPCYQSQEPFVCHCKYWLLGISKEGMKKTHDVRPWSLGTG